MAQVNIDNNKSYSRELVRLAKYNLVACGFQKLTVNSTSGGVSMTVPNDAKYALCVVESDATGTAIRYKQLGALSAPTTSEGIPRADLELFDIQGYQNLINFRAIQAQSGTHSIQIEYYK